jgi:hypothetical protein
MITQRHIEIALPYVLAILFFFMGRYYQSNKDVPQIESYRHLMELQKSEMEAQRLEHKLHITEIQIKYEKVKSDIDTMGVSAIDSLFSKYGF